jgi:uncharacterized membrane protein YfcA
MNLFIENLASHILYIYGYTIMHNTFQQELSHCLNYIDILKCRGMIGLIFVVGFYVGFFGGGGSGLEKIILIFFRSFEFET